MPQTSVGVNALVSLDNTEIGAQSSASLSIPQELRELITKQQNDFVSHLSGKQEWALSNSSFVLSDTDGEAFISNGRAKLELSDDDGTTYVEMPRLNSIDLSLTQNLADVGALDLPLWRYIRPAERSWTVEVDGTYFDADEEPLAMILAAKENRERLDARLTVDNLELEGRIAMGDQDIEASTGGESTNITLEFGGDGELTRAAGALDSSIDILLDGFFDKKEFDVLFEIEDVGDIYDGSGYTETVGISLVDGEEATIEIDIAGNGPINLTQQSS